MHFNLKFNHCQTREEFIFFTLIYLISTFSQEEYRNKDKKYKEFVKK